MGFDFGINKKIDSINAVIGNPIYMAIITTCIIMLIIYLTFDNYVEDDKIKTYVKTFFFIGAVMVGSTAIHYNKLNKEQEQIKDANITDKVVAMSTIPTISPITPPLGVNQPVRYN